MRKSLPVQETITYPRFTVTSTYDPCHDSSSPYEHVIACGHLITTPEPDEPCAPNCYDALQTDSRQASRTTLSKALEKDFYCDACVEERAEASIAMTSSCKQAEKTRIKYRQQQAEMRQKASNFRKCYIAQKVVAVPCDKNGDAVKAYDPYVSAHQFDTAWPPTGDNMFEDVNATPRKTKKSKNEERSSKAGLPTTVSDADEAVTQNVDEAVAEDVNETITEGARWLREEEEREHRPAEEVTRATQRKRAAARPIIISSSPDTGMSSFVVEDSSPISAQTSAQEHDSPTPVAPKKKRDRKRKTTASDETAITPATQPKKRAKATSKTPRPDPGALTSSIDDPSGRAMQIGRGLNLPVGPAKKAPERHSKRAADDEAEIKPVVPPAKRAKKADKTPSPVQAAAPAGASCKTAPSGQKSKSGAGGDTSQSRPKVTKKPSERVCSIL